MEKNEQSPEGNTVKVQEELIQAAIILPKTIHSHKNSFFKGGMKAY